MRRVIPSEFYPYWRHRFLRDRDRLQSRWWKERLEAGRAEMARVIERIGEEGPLRASRFRSAQQAVDRVVGLAPIQGGARVPLAYRRNWRLRGATASRRSTTLPKTSFPPSIMRRKSSTTTSSTGPAAAPCGAWASGSRGEIAAFWDDCCRPRRSRHGFRRTEKDLLQVEVETG